MAVPGATVPQGATQDSGADPEQPKIQQEKSQQNVQQKQQESRPANMGALVRNSRSSNATNASLNMIAVGKNRLAHVHYMFDPAEMQKMAEQTRPFTRDGYAKDQAHKNTACSQDACYMPDRPFEVSDHRGHHVWIAPL